MPKKTAFFIFLLFGFVVLLGVNYFLEPFKKIEEKVGEVIEEVLPKKATSPVQEAFAKLDLEEKIGQILAWPLEIENGEFPAKDQKDQYKSMVAKKPGFYTLFGNSLDLKSAKSAIQKLKKDTKSDLRPWIAVDHEGGQVQRLSGEGFTRLTSWNNMCGEEGDISAKVLRKSAKELSEAGVDVVFGPVVDAGQSNASFLGNRICADDPNLVVLKSGQYINAFRTEGILSVVKHFPGIGAIKKDLHNSFATTSVSAKDVFIYKNLLQYFPDIGVLTSHAGIENQYDDIPCSLSAVCVGELSESFGAVLIFTDALEMKSASYISSASKSAGVKEPTLAEIAKKAILAGNNVLVFGPNVSPNELNAIYDMLVIEYQQNRDFKEKVDKSVQKILDYKLVVKGNFE